MVARGEVWWYEPPDARPRPHLVLTRDAALGMLREVLAVPATRTIRDIPTEVALDEADGMPLACVLTLDNTALVRRALLTQRITVLDPERMEQVCAALRIATGC